MKEQELITPQVFLERLAERLSDARLKGAKKKKRKAKNRNLDTVLDEEMRLINDLYTHLVNTSRDFSNATEGVRHVTDVIISASFSIFATTCLQVMTGTEIDPVHFSNMLKENLNKLFIDCQTQLVIKTKGKE